MRTTTLWQFATIFGLSCMTILVRYWDARVAQTRIDRSALVAACIPLLLLLSTTYGLHFYRATAYPIEYQRGEQILTRPFWHNIFSGFAFHPQFSERYSLRVDDISVIRATRNFLEEKGRLGEWKQVGGSTETLSVRYWAAYDGYVKEMILARCTTYMNECLSTFFFYKPLSLARNLAWLFGTRTTPPDLERFVSPDWGDAVKAQMLALTRSLDERSLRANLLAPIVLAFILVFSVLTSTERRREWTISSIVAVTLFAGSTVPSLIGYPVAFTLAEVGIATGILLQLLLLVAVSMGLQKLQLLSSRTRSTSRSGVHSSRDN